MTLSNDYSLTKLFVTKEIKIYIDGRPAFSMWARPIKDFYLDDKWAMTYQLWTMSLEKWQQMIKLNSDEVFDYIKFIIFDLGQYKEYNSIANSFQNELQEICPLTEIDFHNKQIRINDVIITSEIWNYLLYVIKLYSGEKVTEPQTFDTPEAKAFWLKQKALEDKIKKVRANSGDKESIMKALLYITYCFPSLTFDYLFEQTSAQIHWLHEYAAKSVSYEVNAKAFAAGNVKKGKKLDFFIK